VTAPPRTARHSAAESPPMPPPMTSVPGSTSDGMAFTLGRVGSDIQFIDSIESRQALRVGSRVGVRLAARLTSGGKALLADLPFEEVALLHPGLAADDRGKVADLLPALTETVEDIRSDLISRSR
jgi:DNA-binding IclR family transcriptional regulator